MIPRTGGTPRPPDLLNSSFCVFGAGALFCALSSFADSARDDFTGRLFVVGKGSFHTRLPF
jgi:hypothetical protein